MNSPNTKATKQERLELQQGLQRQRKGKDYTNDTRYNPMCHVYMLIVLMFKTLDLSDLFWALWKVYGRFVEPEGGNTYYEIDDPDSTTNSTINMYFRDDNQPFIEDKKVVIPGILEQYAQVKGVLNWVKSLRLNDNKIKYDIFWGCGNTDIIGMKWYNNHEFKISYDDTRIYKWDWGLFYDYYAVFYYCKYLMDNLDQIMLSCFGIKYDKNLCKIIAHYCLDIELARRDFKGLRGIYRADYIRSFLKYNGMNKYSIECYYDSLTETNAINY